LEASPGQTVHETLSWKSLTQNRAGGVAEVVEQLPGKKNEALSSNPSTTKKKKKKKKTVSTKLNISPVNEF
jgi:hypothetical protein